MVNDNTLEWNAAYEWCSVKGKKCKHADPDNNPEIGYTVCSGEYC
jgi:hypothetical protein